MAKDTENQRATLACLATHLHGTSIATRVRDDGTLVAEFRAIGHSFRFTSIQVERSWSARVWPTTSVFSLTTS
jgi:hypothetical protein